MKFFEFIQKALSENTSDPSSIRVNIFYAVIILIPCIAFCLVWVTITPSLSGLLIAVLGAILAFLTSLFGIKVWQKDKENTPEQK